jgi:hypothetical protein
MRCGAATGSGKACPMMLALRTAAGIAAAQTCGKSALAAARCTIAMSPASVIRLGHDAAMVAIRAS